MYCYVKLTFEKEFANKLREEHPDLLEEWCNIVSEYAMYCNVISWGVEASFKNDKYDDVIEKIETDMIDAFDVPNIMEYVTIERTPVTTLRIVPDDEWVDGLSRSSFFIFELADTLRALKSVCYVKHSYIHIDAQVFTSAEEEFMQTIESFVWAFANEKDTYGVLKVEGRNKEEEARIQTYIEKYQEKFSDKVFEELQKSLMESEGTETLTDENNIYDFPTRFSPEMISYITELRNVAGVLSEIDNIEHFYSRFLLISMDDGWGYSAFLRNIRHELLQFYGSKMKEKNIDLEETMVRPLSEDRGVFESWEMAIDHIKNMSETCMKNNSFAIISYDMSPWLKYVNYPEFINKMRRMEQYSKRILCVLRVPYMDANVIRNMKQRLSDVVAIRSIVVPPVSTENMLIYLKEKLRESRFAVKKECDEVFEKWICQEKNAGNFFGYKTLNKMAGQLIYDRALYKEEGEVVQLIEAKHVLPMLREEVLIEEDGYEILDTLIGVAQVKERIREIVAQVKVQKALFEQGKNVEKPSIHMMFTGNPGTGKTTVARILGQIFKQEGILRKGQFYEIHGRDLIGKHIGHTAPKTQAYCRDAYGSVLFIDEAYSLHSRDYDTSFELEAIAVLLAEMENHRDDMCVIFAGYSDEMKEFVAANAGMESRIPHVIEFPNYSKEELIQIFYKMVDGKFEYEDALRETFEDYIHGIPEEKFNTREFSNARFIRNLYERLWGKAAYRCSLTGEEEIILKKEDMIHVMESESFSKMVEDKYMSAPKRRIGFDI